VVETWKRLHNKDKTFVFGVDCAHAQALQARFHDAGISCAYQDAYTSASERAQIKRGFHEGHYRVVANVGTLTTGVDWDVRCLVLARPTKSEILFVQIVGRALRTAEGKEHALILDHTDTTERLGLVTDIHHEQLDGGRFGARPAKRGPPLPKPCPQCTMLLPRGTKVCPSCGHVREVVSSVTEREGELVEFTGTYRKKGKTNAHKHPYTTTERMRFYAQLRGYAASYGYKPGWAAFKYEAKFGAMPPWDWNTITPMQAGPEVMNFIRGVNMKWARSPQNPKNQPPPPEPEPILDV